MLKRLLQLTIILIILFLAKEANAGIIIRPVHHFGLVGYWDFQEGQGTTANDHSGNSNHGTLMWMATSTPTGGWTDGRIGSGLEFDGDDDYVDCGASNIPEYGPMTVSAWVNIASHKNYNMPVSKFDNNGSKFAFRIYINSSGYYSFGAQNSSSDSSFYSAVGSSAINTGEWHQLVGTIDNGTMYLYVDGTQYAVGIDEGWDVTGAGAPVIIGDRADHAVDFNFNGLIDEVRIYNRALSVGEIQRLYKLSQPTVAKGISNTGLVGYWPFEEGTGTFAGDHSGQGNHGTWNGTGSHWAQGKYSNGGQFNGSSDYVLINKAIVTSPPFTVCAWARLDQFPTDYGSEMAIFVIQDPVNGGRHFTLRADDIANKAQFNAYDGNSSISESTVAVTPGVWQFYCGVANTSSPYYTVYLDAGNKGTNTVQRTPTNLNVTNIGASNPGGYTDFMDGLIDEVRIYNRALSTSEVAALYKSGRGNVSTSQTNRLADGLVGMWSFDGPDIYWPTNTASDRSGQGNHGAITNMNTSTAPTAGMVGQALEFDGSDDIVKITTSPISPPITISMWLKYISGRANDYFFWWANSGDPLTRIHGEWGVQDFRIIDTDYDTIIVDFTASSDVWNHIVCVVEGTTATTYVNGQYDDQGSNASYDTTSYENLGIGARYTEQTHFGGFIDEVRIYNRALSADEVKRLYNMGR